MKKLCFALFVSLSFWLNAQTADDFSDGDFTNNPTWIGNTDSFEVNNQELHLLAPPNTSESYIATANLGTVDGFWECTMRLEFNPSSGNRAFFYLMSDTLNLKVPLNGYFVMVGNTTDEVSLYKQTGATSTKIIDGIDGLCNSSMVNIKIKVTRDAIGNFELFADTSQGFANYESQGMVFDNTFMQSKALGFLCDYTATRSDKFWFDNVLCTAQISQNNPIATDTIQFHEVLINEFYADEAPSYGLPPYEFIELKNNTNQTIYLSNCFIADAADTVSIPSDSILANSYLILCKTTAVADYQVFGRTVGIPSFPSLNNTGDKILLLNSLYEVIDSLSYSTDWYRNLYDDFGNAKKDGGYTLERFDTNNICGAFYEWYPSIDSIGGTPGAENSTLNLSIPPLNYAILSAEMVSDSSVHIVLNNSLPSLQLSNISITYFNIDLGVLVPIENFILDATQTELTIFIADTFQYGIEYTLSLDGLYDCYHNSIAMLIAQFYKTKELEINDLRINELLFNPISGGSDFIELINLKNQAIDLSGMQILEYDVLNPSQTTDSVSLQNIIMPPNAYSVLTEDSFQIKNQYYVQNPSWLIERSIPNYDDNEGILVVKTPNGETIDSLYFNKSWQFSLLDDLNGVSLERIDALEETNNKANWQSAARTYGYATPTARNSQYFSENSTTEIQIEPEVFTPNEDGVDDFCILSFNPTETGSSMTIIVYDALGHEVKLLAQNQTIGAQNQWKWDGTNNQFEKAAIGIYVVVFDWFSANGKHHVEKKKVVLGTHF
ncbi:MAG: lamin tail domain-containing protein [Chitinophagales bacterium]|nr:lamin tail domain-containing protein [Chitinophagales bacterium]